MMKEIRELLTLSFIFLTATPFTDAQWIQPYFEAPQQEGIVFEPFNTANNFQPILMEEEIPIDYILAIINYTGTTTPELRNFIGTNTNSHLGAVVTRASEASKWEIHITKRQDYEELLIPSYNFQVIIDSTPVRIAIVVENIFDNNPVISYNGNCIAMELHAPLDTNCIFNVFDPDGLYGNSFTFHISGDNNEENLFELRPLSDDGNYNKQYSLFVIEELRYEERVLYTFQITVYDVSNINSGTMRAILEVDDYPSLDPQWVKTFATGRFKEKTAQQFSVIAIDGDTKINKPIHYELQFNPNQDYSDLVSIATETGIINVNEIDRDALQQEVFEFNIIAYKYDNRSWAIDSSAVLIVDDINDNTPIISLNPKTISIYEATYLTLPIDQFEVNDIDLGTSATYTVEISEPDGTTIQYSEALTVIPNAGYQKSSFMITVSNAPLLDYEDINWRSFNIKIIATEIEDSTHKNEEILTINLINWNDESPVFTESTYTTHVFENITKDQFLIQVLAEDRDFDDTVVHSIVGSLSSQISCSEDGQLYTALDDVFDYEKQTSVLVQIQATDVLRTDKVGEQLHVVFTQLTIVVDDVNDEKPDLRMPRVTPNITENSEGNTLVTDGIIASDPDTEADLVFTIDWDSSYATKSGQVAADEDYRNCFIIEPHPVTRNIVYGHLMVNPDFVLEREIDYEKYEVIYLTIIVEDRGQQEGEGTAEAVLTIRVDDVNDNRPAFNDNNLAVERSVVEEALKDTSLGTIIATDADGPGNNEIIYLLEPIDDTPDGWVDINPSSGELKVISDEIDCDEPRLDTLKYKITVSDGELSNEAEISIRIIDINNKMPVLGTFETTIKLYENATTDDEIVTVVASDKDRDSPHNVLQYLINYTQFPNLLRYFEIGNTGLLKVRLQADSVLDRDHGEDVHIIYITIEDNYLGNGRVNSIPTSVTVILLDVNDNAPQMPNPSTFTPSLSENEDVDFQINTLFYAPDADDFDTPNAWVSYRIVAIEANADNADPLPDPTGIFEMVDEESTKNRNGYIMVKKSLRGYYGTWKITIEAYDHGDEWDSQIIQRSTETYIITIDPYNYYDPEIFYPTNSRAIRLSYDRTQSESQLFLTNGQELPLFEALDPDGGIFGQVRFELTSSNNIDHEYFQIIPQGPRKSELQVARDKTVSAIIYKVNIRAIDGGSKYVDLTDVSIAFIDMLGEPAFKQKIFETSFTENSTGMGEIITIFEAEDAKNIGLGDDEELFPVYYFIVQTYNPNDAQYFKLDSVTRELSLAKELDREEIDNHEIQVVATNNIDGPPSGPLKEDSLLIIKISVTDINDNSPSFELDLYGVGITTSDQLAKILFTVVAIDPDLNDPVTYHIAGEITAHGNHISNGNDQFLLNQETGIVTLNFVPQSNQKGYFEFNIEARDSMRPIPHTDMTNAKIFIIAESNRVSFIFNNDVEYVKPNENYLAQTFATFYEYECYIDDIQQLQKNGVPQVNYTDVKAHFIQNNEAIEASIIQDKSSEFSFITRLRTTLLSERGLTLEDVPTNNADDEGTSMEDLFKTILIVVSVVLGTLCVVLLVAFVVRTRNFNRQLKALSTVTDFGSTPSILNRQAPTTNIFNVEGSNPALMTNNNGMTKSAYDDEVYSYQSNESDESDFMGIDNDPNFMNDNRRESINAATIQDIRQKSVNPMVNGGARDDDSTRF